MQRKKQPAPPTRERLPRLPRMTEPYRPIGGSSPFDDASPMDRGLEKPLAPFGDETLLESVLRRTLLRDASEEGYLDDKEQAALRQVASRHCGRSLEEPPVLIELVEAALEHQFPLSGNNAEFLRSLSQPVAESLREDPFAWKQLELLWARLCEVVP